jgi:hypothetical protein
MYLALLALGAAVAATVGYVRARARGEKSAFDVHLPVAFEDSVLRALKVEKNPEKLAMFGKALVEDYPVAAGVLMTRARNIQHPNMTGSFHRNFRAARPESISRSREHADEGQRVAAALAADPRLAHLPPPRIAERLHVRLPVVQAVLASSDSAGHGLIVDPNILVSYLGEPSAPTPVDQKTVAIAIAAVRGKPSAKKILNHLRMQDPHSTRAAERIVAQALWAKAYAPKKDTP